MIEETKFPQNTPRRRSSLKRQRLAVLIVLGVVIVLAVAFALVWRFTSRILVEYPNGDNVVDADGTKYYSVKRDDVWVMINQHGDICPKTADGLYKTKDGTLVMIDVDDGTPTVVATVLLNGTEATMLDANSGSYDILLYPMLERKDIQSIEIKNTKDHFRFERMPNGTFALVNYTKAPFNEVMFSTLVVVTGYTRTIARLDLSPENPDAEGFRQHGYAEYGLPENPDDAENYFVITSTDGTSHKVIIGDIILDDTGYYARYADRNDVYVLSQMKESEFNSTLSATLLSTKEDYVTPTVTSTFGEYNYMDVTDFTIYKASGNTSIPDLSAFEKLVQFSFSPIEARDNTYYEHIPYSGQGKLEGYAINDTRADACLLSLLDMTPGKTVKLYDDDGKDSDGEESDANLTNFITTYGLGYAISFTWNVDRQGADQDYAPTETIPHQIWISKLTKTEDGAWVYYMFNETYDMVVMVDRSYVEFLEWNDFKWVEPTIFDSNIIYFRGMEIKIKNGTSFDANEENAGLSDVTYASFESNYVDANGNAANANSGNADIRVFYNYIQNGVSSGNNNPFADTLKFKMFYQTLYYSELYEAMPSGTEELQEQLKASGEHDLEITMRFDLGNGETLTKTYRFYFCNPQDHGFSGCYVTINNVGAFYMRQARVDKIIEDVGRLLHPTAQIVPLAIK